MKSSRRPFTCLQCLLRNRTPSRSFHPSRPTRASEGSSPSAAARPPSAPKPVIDIRHIRENPDLYEQNCLERNYKNQAAYPARINDLFAQWQARQRDGRARREKSNLIRHQIAYPATLRDEQDPGVQSIKGLSREELLEQARVLKADLAAIEDDEARLTQEIESLAVAIPNLTSEDTPRGDEPRLLSYINDHPEPEPLQSDRVWRSHVHIGSELGLLDFAGAATATGWGWYYLLNEAAQLEQALIQYALTVATRYRWAQVSPPSMVYSHIAAACGYQPRDVSGEQQIYSIAQSQADIERGRPELCLAGTAEIPLAGMKADTQLEESDLPMRRVGVSRSYRAEAGARGVDTKGLYRVHEFTKVELFAWTEPDEVGVTEVFDEMVDMQTEILQSLGLHCRILEMPSTDLGASATRKIDIEAFFPSRREKNDGWGEVTSASICTDYQTRRLGTRVRIGGKMNFPWTVNGTAMAVPRVLAAILENGWDEGEMTVTIPEVLRPWMDGMEKIGLKHRLR